MKLCVETIILAVQTHASFFRYDVITHPFICKRPDGWKQAGHRK